ncbi:MAG: DUF2177 family protein [Anaerolineales bacterium]|uniref:DUF2177 family protein n=1 Tax=Candidatus Villigracilis vicinus TaxID=3140679 RepID=UPI003134ADF7|nr:DUF2177 family protein [Anaerolineales bacterium]MBK9779094.1 DUF2177 family protein [Anaerolineales bacterium]
MKLKLYLITFFTFLVIDSLWLGLVAPAFYRSQIGFIMADQPNFLAAGLFYILFILGLVFFVVEPGVREQTLTQAVLRGALFGLVTYATYDLTNLATLAGWPVLLTVVDLAWGTVLSSTVTLVSVWVGKRFIK